MVNPRIKQHLTFVATVVGGVVGGTVLGFYFIFWWIAKGEGTRISPPPTASAVGCYYFEGTIAEIQPDSLTDEDPLVRVTIRFERLDSPPAGSRCIHAYRELDSILKRSDSLYTFCVDADSAAALASVGNDVVGASGLIVIRGWGEKERYDLQRRSGCK